MTEQHPIIPPPELVQQWIMEEDDPHEPNWQAYEEGIAARAAQWGADMELEACCTELDRRHNSFVSRELREARRPKPPSLKEQALAALSDMSIEPCVINGVDANASVRAKYDIIRRAIEALPDD